jgi:hypothetical protein
MIYPAKKEGFFSSQTVNVCKSYLPEASWAEMIWDLFPYSIGDLPGNSGSDGFPTSSHAISVA